MTELQYMLKSYESKCANKIKTLAGPLKSFFDIDEFIYTNIDPQGYFFSISSQPEPSQYYFSNDLYKNDPLIRHPDNFENEVIMPVTTPIVKQRHIMDQKFGYSGNSLMTVIKKEGRKAHKFLFNRKNGSKEINDLYANNLPLFHKFIDYFLNEWETLRADTEKYTVNIGHLSGKYFFETKHSQNTSLQNKINFLKKLGLTKDICSDISLSKQEIKCLKLIAYGKTLKETAEVLNLSPRTVEHYFDSIKNKMNCFTKSEVIERFHLLTTLRVVS